MLYKKIALSFVLVLFLVHTSLMAQITTPVPPEQRGKIDMERTGMHDANRIRTTFYNYGMVGDYPADPINVDLSIFHSVEVPKGSGENYSDGGTPFVLSKLVQESGITSFRMETGYRERQGTSPLTNKTMRFEPRPGYFQTDPTINKGRSVALSNDDRTWPDKWYDKLNDSFDPGWAGKWNGYFGKAPAADQESYCVYDDQYYDDLNFHPDSRDNTRMGLGLRVEQRGFQWSNPQAGNVIFFHYDITNESTTDYNNNIIFGIYLDAGVGGSGIGVDGIAESDDDNAFFDKQAGLNLVYTWDKNGHGMRGTTGYLGYSYLETPGNSTDGIDNDLNGIIDEKRDSGPGEKIAGQDNIRAYVASHYNLDNFIKTYGDLEKRPAFQAGVWFTGDENMNWVAEFDDTGADGIFGTGDPGEKDGIPTLGEPNFDKTDLEESDMIGLTGFKMNRIKAGSGSPSTNVDDIVFFDDGRNWPQRLYNRFISADSSFDVPLVLNYNIGFLFASGPFNLINSKTERFSLALGFGQDLRELTTTTRVVQQIYKANYQFSVPPPMPTLKASTGDHYVLLTWSDQSERAYDPVTNSNDFEGYRVYRSTDPTFLDPQVIYTATGSGPIGNGKPIAQFDLTDGVAGFSTTTVEGVAYYLGNDAGIKHNFKDTTVTNGQRYYYAVTSYDKGSDSIQIYPSENAIAVSQTLRGGTILPKNVVEVVPNPQSLGYVSAIAESIVHDQGTGSGSVNIAVLNPELVPDNQIYKIVFDNPADSVKAIQYSLINTTKGDTIFATGTDFNGVGSGPVGTGLLPIIQTPSTVLIDSANTGFTSDSKSTIGIKYRYANALPIQVRRPGFPSDFEIVFGSTVMDTSIAAIGIPSKPVKFSIVAHTSNGDTKLKFRFRDLDNDSTISSLGEYIDIVTYSNENPNVAMSTWRMDFDTTGQYIRGNIVKPTLGDSYLFKIKKPFSSEDVFTFRTVGQKIDNNLAKNQFNNKPYVVPNPYVGAASFEPQRFAVSGRGERKIEFRNLPENCTIRIYTINGELVKSIEHFGGLTKGYAEWDLRTKDNLDAAPGLYIFHVDSKEVGTYIGKFAIIK